MNLEKLLKNLRPIDNFESVDQVQMSLSRNFSNLEIVFFFKDWGNGDKMIQYKEVLQALQSKNSNIRRVVQTPSNILVVNLSFDQ